MLGSEAVSLIQRRAGYRTDKADEILAELKIAQQRMERNGVRMNLPGREAVTFYPWFLVSELHTKTLTPGEERVPLPTGFLREYEPDAVWRYDANAANESEVWVPLVKDDLDFLRSKFPGTGKPQAYALTGFYYRVLPTPDAAYTLKHMFYIADEVVSSLTENKWLLYAPMLLIAKAALEIAVSLRENPVFEKWAANLYQEESVLLYNATEERDHINRKYAMGGED